MSEQEQEDIRRAARGIACTAAQIGASRTRFVAAIAAMAGPWPTSMDDKRYFAELQAAVHKIDQ